MPVRRNCRIGVWHWQIHKKAVNEYFKLEKGKEVVRNTRNKGLKINVANLEWANFCAKIQAY
mgnify:CR=1 FL=1